ncbi:YihY/virulence factor BrkB family protein [Aquipuribacter hungaricus]|uniref:YihY/virulence factor BrkB family protein n=1 Tax=Aquipuribacter hungaricus TaxID=545624 RepID=A0ABV7WDY0_9MICO
MTVVRSGAAVVRELAPGGRAAAPRHIPPRGWLMVLRRVGRRVLADRFPLLSAGIAFFAVLSIAPVLLTAVSVYGAVNTPEEALEQLSAVAGVLPPTMRQVVEDQVLSITAASTEVHTVRGLVALLLALWTATTAMTYLVDALTLAYDETETRSFPRLVGLSLALVLGSAVALGALLAAAGFATGALARAPGPVLELAGVLVWVVLAALMALGLAVLYRVAPDRRSPRWAWVSTGALAATALWVATSLALFAYVRDLGTYETTYGSLAGVAISMLWLWLTVLLVLLGAALNAEAERQTVRDSTVGQDRPMGERGAVVADTVVTSVVDLAAAETAGQARRTTGGTGSPA